MKILPIPESEQMNAMLNGTVYDLVRAYIDNPSPYNLQKYLTIDRRKLINFLNMNPSSTKAYFQKCIENQASHDVGRISKDGTDYIYVWMDHGISRDKKKFKSIAEVVAEHLLVAYGMY